MEEEDASAPAHAFDAPPAPRSSLSLTRSLSTMVTSRRKSVKISESPKSDVDQDGVEMVDNPLHIQPNDDLFTAWSTLARATAASTQIVELSTNYKVGVKFYVVSCSVHYRTARGREGYGATIPHVSA